MSVPAQRRFPLPALALGLVLPATLAAAWIPVRDSQPNVDVALALVLAVMAVGALGSVAAALVAAASAAWWFDYFDTFPYAHPAIARGTDLATFAALTAVGAAGGVLAARWTSQRRLGREEGRDLLLLLNAAGLVATGVEPVEVLGGIVADVRSALSATDCEFSTEALDVGHTVIATRDGELSEAAPERGAWRLALPVWAQGSVMGHLVAVGDGPFPPRDRLVLAIALADQAGAALAACGAMPLPPDDPPLVPRLRLVRPGAAPSGTAPGFGGGAGDAGSAPRLAAGRRLGA